MSINALGSFAELGLGKLLGNKPPFLEILAQPNEILSPNGLLQRVIGKALGTQNAARINDFLEQSGLSLSALPQPSQGKNGANVYRFPTPERFWQSIGTFEQSGNALSLARSLTGNAPAQTPALPAATNPNSIIASKQGVSAQLERARLAPQQTQTKDKKPLLSSDKLTDSKGIQYAGRPDDLKGDEVFGVKVTVKPEDTRESLLQEGNRAAVRAAGYKEPQATRIADARTAQLAEQGVTGIVDVNTKTAQKTGATDDTELKNLRKAKEMSYYVTGAEIKEYDRIDNQQQLQDAIAAGKPLTQEMLERSGVDREKLNGLLKEMNWQPIPTFDEAVDKLAAQKRTDVLAWRAKAMSSAAIDTNFSNSKWYGMPDAQITAETKREATVDVQRQIGKGELQVRREDRPDSISATNYPKWQTDAKLLIEKYMPGIAALNTPEGIKTTAIEAFTASFVNARLFGATDFYVDQSRFHNEQERGNAQLMSVAGSTIGELQNLTMAGKTVEAAMATTKVARGIQILNESGRVGKLIVQALPSAATFGGLQTAKETVKAATGNSEGAQQAVTNIVRETTVGAVFGVFEPLKVGVRVPAVIAGSYGVEKVFGATDKEAAMRALTNGIFSIAGGRGRAAEELAGKTIRVTGENGTATNVKVTVDAGKRVVLTEVAANVTADLQVKASQLKTALGEMVNNGGLKPSEVVIDAATGQRVTVPKRALNELLQDPLFRVKSGEEFRQRYGKEVTYSPKVREQLRQIEKVSDKVEQLKQLQTLEADVLLSRVDAAKLPQITKQAQTNQDFMFRCGNVNETLSTNPTKAKTEVDGANAKLAKIRKEFYGKPDNIQVDASSKIVEVEEVKFFGKGKLEELGAMAKSDPKLFVQVGQGKDGFIQFNKHVRTINEIKNNPEIVKGIDVKGVSNSVKYVLTLPKFEGDDFLTVNKAVKDMQAAWKSRLGIDVEVRYSNFSTTDIQQMTQRLEQTRNK